MLKNQNGIPDATGVCKTAPCICNPDANQDDGDGRMTFKEGVMALSGAPIAYAYVPDQKFRMMYSAKDALSHGTLFEELYLPLGVYGNG